MIKLNRDELRDKIYACWLGKNIGGTLGTPFEGRREMLNVTDFQTEAGAPLPNDDLDLQLAWLKAIQENGPEKLNERILGEYWLEYISPYWNEYGVCKSNMARGLVPPLSGDYDNEWKHSNGAWIRTEVWACLYPALVERSMECSYMDACVDHGVGEGTIAAVFVAAMESAAFVVSDVRELISIGLSNIPTESRVSRFVRMAVEAFDSGKSWQEARNLITDASLADPELGWFQAPANVAYVIIGLLYGGGDFKKTLLTAVNCGDDTDCTAATAGALMGIMHGRKILPDDWCAHIGDSIITVALNRGALYGIPLTCSDLTDAIIELHPTVLRGRGVEISDEATAVEAGDIAAFSGTRFGVELARRKPYSFRHETPTMYVEVTYDRAPCVAPGEEIGIEIAVRNKFRMQHHCSVEFALPEGWSVSGARNLSLKENFFPEPIRANYTITAGEVVGSSNRVILTLDAVGRSDCACIPLVILG